MINVCVYEDIGYQNLQPLTYTRPAYLLLAGLDPLLSKIYRYFAHANITLHCRDYLKPLVQDEAAQNLGGSSCLINQINLGAPGLFLNGRVVFDAKLSQKILATDMDQNFLYTYRGTVVAAYVQGEFLAYMAATLQSLPVSAELIEHLRHACVTQELTDVTLIETPLDLIHHNLAILRADCTYKQTTGIIKSNVSSGVHIYHEENVFIDKTAFLEDTVVLNAKNGPIYIEDGAYIEAGSRLEGPLFIGQNSRVLGGRLACSSIGPNCKVGGEISHSVLLRYSNKAHYGFLGHSYLGAWVNLGAGTTTSNLKNTYGQVRLQQGTVTSDSGVVFLGSIIGDHVKTGIGTLLNTGTVLGYGTNLFGAEMPPKYVAPFTWGSPATQVKYALDKFLLTAERAMARRQLALKKVESEIISLLYAKENTA